MNNIDKINKIIDNLCSTTYLSFHQKILQNLTANTSPEHRFIRNTVGSYITRLILLHKVSTTTPWMDRLLYLSTIVEQLLYDKSKDIEEYTNPEMFLPKLEEILNDIYMHKDQVNISIDKPMEPAQAPTSSTHPNINVSIVNNFSNCKLVVAQQSNNQQSNNKQVSSQGCSKVFIIKVLMSARDYVKGKSLPSILTFDKDLIMRWLESAKNHCCQPTYAEEEAHYGGPPFIVNNSSTYWTEPTQLYTWWKNNIERRNKFKVLQTDAEYNGNDARKQARARWCKVVILLSENIRQSSGSMNTLKSDILSVNKNKITSKYTDDSRSISDDSVNQQDDENLLSREKEDFFKILSHVITLTNGWSNSYVFSLNGFTDEICMKYFRVANMEELVKVLYNYEVYHLGKSHQVVFSCNDITSNSNTTGSDNTLLTSNDENILSNNSIENKNFYYHWDLSKYMTEQKESNENIVLPDHVLVNLSANSFSEIDRSIDSSIDNEINEIIERYINRQEDKDISFNIQTPIKKRKRRDQDGKCIDIFNNTQRRRKLSYVNATSDSVIISIKQNKKSKLLGKEKSNKKTNRERTTKAIRRQYKRVVRKYYSDEENGVDSVDSEELDSDLSSQSNSDDDINSIQNNLSTTAVDSNKIHNYNVRSKNKIRKRAKKKIFYTYEKIKKSSDIKINNNKVNNKINSNKNIIKQNKVKRIEKPLILISTHTHTCSRVGSDFQAIIPDFNNEIIDSNDSLISTNCIWKHYESTNNLFEPKDLLDSELDTVINVHGNGNTIVKLDNIDNIAMAMLRSSKYLSIGQIIVSRIDNNTIDRQLYETLEAALSNNSNGKVIDDYDSTFDSDSDSDGHSNQDSNESDCSIINDLLDSIVEYRIGCIVHISINEIDKRELTAVTVYANNKYWNISNEEIILYNNSLYQQLLYDTVNDNFNNINILDVNIANEIVTKYLNQCLIPFEFEFSNIETLCKLLKKHKNDLTKVYKGININNDSNNEIKLSAILLFYYRHIGYIDNKTDISITPNNNNDNNRLDYIIDNNKKLNKKINRYINIEIDNIISIYEMIVKLSNNQTIEDENDIN